ncbi:helix-turn-helix domain-containing protein [Bacillus sp. CGMCC 1.16607]|uniref:helix-turn-helix domain-containing protein n=1 Tax=Bacillus sp. CGMCC 1.16607 TaxID=3351842 RepID=UPI00363FB18D
MRETKADIILHPVRMRILQSLLNQKLSASQIKELFPDIPQATLYRHLKRLLEANVIQIVDEIPVRGTVEKIYTIYQENISIDLEYLSQLSREDHMSLFIKFMANLMGEYERYLSQDKIDLVKDMVSLRQVSLYLTDEELLEVIKQIRDAFGKASNNEPNSDRKKRTFGTIIIPEPKDN